MQLASGKIVWQGRITSKLSKSFLFCILPQDDDPILISPGSDDPYQVMLSRLKGEAEKGPSIPVRERRYRADDSAP